MPCFHPIAAFEHGGRVRIGFDRGDGRPFRVPCGKCPGCLLERSRQWAVRCMHEASVHDENCFITLTYDDDHLPAGGSLVLEHFQKFVRRLRKRIAPRKVRFYHAGEYGTQYGRPHYHALLFGYDFADKVECAKRGDFPVWTSRLLSELWDAGSHQIGSVSFESAAYVAAYVVGTHAKGVVGVDADGEVRELQREYSTMSRRPGIGKAWFDRYRGEVYPADGIVVAGVLRKPPRFYDLAVAMELPGVFEEVQERRRRARRTDLVAAEAHCVARLSLKRRDLE